MLLEKRLADLKDSPQGSGSNGSSCGCVQKKDVRCFKCGRFGHMARNCRGGSKQSNDPDAGS